MIGYQEARSHVLSDLFQPPAGPVPLADAAGRVLAENIHADRDLPPYDRATMDGIAIDFDAFEGGCTEFLAEGMAAAGSPQEKLKESRNCLEIATGAVVPAGTDTVIRYEDLKERKNRFAIAARPRRGQNIHRKGSDTREGDKLLPAGTCIGPSEIAVMASVGSVTPAVRSLPRVSVISTGDELVAIESKPKAHQVRKSNVYTLASELRSSGIPSQLLHLPDDPRTMRSKLESALHENDVLLLSGGVSRGRFDFIPGVIEELGGRKIFHRVAQKPGKPFWFGKHDAHICWIFAFPGNPVSTFLNYHLYFRPWLSASMGQSASEVSGTLLKGLSNPTDLTRFYPVRLTLRDAVIGCDPVEMNGSGDFLSLTRADAFARLNPGEDLKTGELVSLIPYKTTWHDA